MNDHVIASLVERRRILAGELDKAQGQVHQLHADLASLDAVIRQFDPEYPLATIRPKYQRQATAAEFGSMSRAVLDVLRRAGDPLSAKEIGARIMADRGLNAGDPKLRRTMNKRVDMALRYQRTNGMVRETAAEDGVGWEIE